MLFLLFLAFISAIGSSASALLALFAFLLPGATFGFALDFGPDLARGLHLGEGFSTASFFSSLAFLLGAGLGLLFDSVG